MSVLMAPAAKVHPVEIEELVRETESVLTLRFALPEGDSLDFTPGQFLRVHFPGETEHRDYSIASSPLEKGRFELTVQRAGAFTERLFRLRPGDPMSVEGPYGRWLYRDGPEPLALVSGGTGIAPFRSMIRYALSTRPRRRIDLVYSARTPADILYRSEAEGWRSRGIGVHVTVTRPKETAEPWTGPSGRITLDTLKKAVADFEAAIYYLCGPAGLVSELTGALRRAGLPAERIRSEIWGEF